MVIEMDGSSRIMVHIMQRSAYMLLFAAVMSPS